MVSEVHSKNETHYLSVMYSLTEHYYFGTLFRRHDFKGAIIWSEQFKAVTEGFKKELEFPEKNEKESGGIH